MNIVFFGTDVFAATHLSRLIQDGHAIKAVVTAPDRARDRGMKVKLLPVKMLALERLIPVFQPEDLSDAGFQEELRNCGADLFVVISYGRFLPKAILEIPKLFCVNVHPSLLPKYRGAAPINRALINGEARTGVSVMKMNERMDAGEVMVQEALDIAPEWDAEVLWERLAELGASCLSQAVKKIGTGDFTLTPQDESQATYAHKLNSELERIDWGRSAAEIHNLIRGLAPRPAAHTFFEGRQLKILEAAVVPKEGTTGADGTVAAIVADGIVVNCGQGKLLLKEVQAESSRAMSARSFCIGHKLAKGMQLGEQK